MKWTRLKKEIAYAFIFNNGFENRNKAADFIIKQKGKKGNKSDIYEEINQLMKLGEVIEENGLLVYDFKDDDSKDFFQKLRPIFLQNKEYFFNVLENMESQKVLATASNENLVRDILNQSNVEEKNVDVAVKYYKKFKEKVKKGIKSDES